MTRSGKKDPGIAFLGVCERAAFVREGDTNLFKWNILGLKQVLLSHVFPFPFRDVWMGWAFYDVSAAGAHHFTLADDSGKEIGVINIRSEVATATNDVAVTTDVSPRLLVPEHGWLTAFFPLRDSLIIIERPGRYEIRLQTEEGPRTVGTFVVALLDPAPFTPDRIAAIRSDPGASKAVRFEFGCKQCSSKCRAYAALDRSDKIEAEGWVWFQDLAERFSCECGKTNFDLTIIRRNLHGLLGLRLRETEDIKLVPLYEKSSLETIRTAFISLLDASAREEQLQKFIEDNPILLHQFPAVQLFRKPPILTFFVADFAVVTPQRELILIELEKSNTRLLKKDGGIAAELNHAFDQVSSWLHIVDEHRLAVLDSLKIDRDRVSMVRGVVIAGRDRGYDAQHLRKLKGRDLGRRTFLTYDDLFFALDALIRRIDAL